MSTAARDRRRAERHRAEQVPPIRRASIVLDGDAAPTGREFRIGRDTVDRSGLVDVLGCRTDERVGRPRNLTLRTLLVAMMINGLRPHHLDLITEVARVINSFSRTQRRALGIENWTVAGSYDRVQRLIAKVEQILAAGLPVQGEGWAAHLSGQDILNLLLAASCPDDLLSSTSVAIDGTDIPSWGRIHGDEETVQLDLEEVPEELPRDLAARKTPKPARGKKKAAVLGVGAARGVEGRPATLSLTFDHRIVDGADAARFLADVVTGIEAGMPTELPAG